MSSTNDAVKRLHVIVIGAGIAGLSVGRALREHHDVTILEQSRFKTETGAAIHCGPNASRILLKWGANLDRLESPNCLNIFEYTAEGKLLYHRPVDTNKIFGAPWLLNHRIALHRELLTLATSTDPALPGKPAEIRLASKVVSVDAKEGKVKLADGSELQGDIIVGGDGIKSTLQESVLGDAAVTAKPSGHSAYRFLIPFDKLKALGDADIDRVMAEPSLSMFVGSDRRLVCYTCRFEGKDLLNVVAMVPDVGLFEESSESWFAQGSLKDLAASFSSFSATVKKLIAAATECSLYQLRDQDPLETWVRDRCILIGDAAHPMLPHLGQGGSQAIEDAEALAYVLSTKGAADDIPAALARVQQLRWYRATMAQERSRQQAMGPRPGSKEELLGKNTFEFTGFLYDYFGAQDWEERVRQGKGRDSNEEMKPVAPSPAVAAV